MYQLHRINKMKNFTYKEFLRSETADAKGINNHPKGIALFNVRLAIYNLVANVLQPLRDEFRVPIIISSGYRCALLNEAVGGSPTSQHCKGMAADFYPACTNRCECLGRMYVWMRDNLDFDQLIYYRSRYFIHVSYVSQRDNRHQIIVKS